MDFDDHISLGEGLASDQGQYASGQNHRHGAVQASHRRNNLIIGLIVSVLLHGVIAAVFLRFDFSSSSNPVPSTVQIQFTPSNPLLAASEEELEEPVEQEQVETVLEEQPIEQELAEFAVEESSPEQSQQSVQVEEQAELTDLSGIEQTPAVAPITNPANTPPTVLAIQQSLEAIESDRVSRFYSYDCSVIELKAGIRECERPDNRDFTVFEQNPVYDFHNPVIELSRSEKTVTTVARNSRALAERLAASSLPPGLGAYVLEEIEAGIEINSNNGNRVLQNMDVMVDKSAAAVQARRVYDPWVQQQTKVLGARKIYTKQELDQLRDCASIVLALLTLPPGEFVRCWGVGNNPLLLLNLLGL